ncbi:MAG: 1-deoxy-D-xylulose-5-phosphate reductoisomerase [Erysipelotrichia bacterium]|nr:1-deoxy-D-xylulose-5-phosphate reductoisomerase [Erysipelotrichia bacterium]
MKKVILLGATGSIGMQSIDVILQHSDTFEIIALSCGKNIQKLKEILSCIKVEHVCVQYAKDREKLAQEYPHIHFYDGEAGILSLLDLDGDIVINALVGFVGLKPTLKTIETKKVLALANKESLVVGGMLVKQYLKKYNGVMYPIDSEHSAIFQALQGNRHEEIEKLVFTASGGSFRDKTREELKEVSVEQALAHPNWSMGERITIDSATMMNKGFEVIEAHYLFDIDFNDIEVLINKESVIHSMVHYVDSSFMAQLGTADMRLPIQYALSYPKRMKLNTDDVLDLAKIGTLHFKEVSYERYPLLKLAYEAGRKGGNSGAIINGADEAAIDLFLNHKISFLQIEELIMEAYEKIDYIEFPTLADLQESDRLSREFVYQRVKGG